MELVVKWSRKLIKICFQFVLVIVILIMKFNLHSYCLRLHTFGIAEVYNFDVKETNLSQRPLEEIREINSLFLSPAELRADSGLCTAAHAQHCPQVCVQSGLEGCPALPTSDESGVLCHLLCA